MLTRFHSPPRLFSESVLREESQATLGFTSSRRSSAPDALTIGFSPPLPRTSAPI